MLHRRLPQYSRARLQDWIKDGRVLINGAARRTSYLVRMGDVADVQPAEPAPLRATAEEIPLTILYEDEDVVAIDKPAGMVVHSGAGVHSGTLVNALLHRFGRLSRAAGEMRPGIVHRLDKETSGLIMVAKNDDAHRKLAAQFARREVKKTYIALVHGWPKKDRGTISASISRDRVRRIRMTTRGTGGRDAVSHYSVVRQLDTAFGKFTLVEVKIDTGRTHQIRVHMASLGHAVVGDALYGAPREMRARRGRATNEGAAISLSRNFLHAAQLELTHPRTGEQIALKSPLPPELQTFLATLERDVASNVSAKG